MEPGGHAVLMRQVYNKTRSYLEWMAARVGGSVTIVDDGDMAALGGGDHGRRRASCSRKRSPIRWCARRTSTRCATVIDRARADRRRRCGWCSTPPSPRRGRSRCRRSQNGVDIIVASGTKSLGGNDRDMWGYIATNDTQFANSVMDLIAMRGGILDWRRAAAIVVGLRRRQRVARAPIGDGGEGRRIPGVASQGQRGLPSVAAESSRPRPRSTGTTRVTARCCRSGSTAPTRIARGISPTCSPRR